MGDISDPGLSNTDLECPFLPCSSSASIFSHDLGEQLLQLLPTSTLFHYAIAVDLLFPFGTYDMPLQCVSFADTSLTFLHESSWISEHNGIGTLRPL